jgi:ribonucleoside-diphosphate reductase alpha chain
MTASAPMSTFALTTFNEKYAGDLSSGGKETWSKMSHRVATKVLAAVDAEKELVDEVETAIDAKEFVPGGRYLYAVGRPFHQTQNCLLMRAQDSREGWAEHTSNAFMALMTGAGIGAVYSDLRPAGAKIRKTGGTASGPLPLMQATNELSRAAIQGGKRRGAVWAGLHWNHPDCWAFIHMKDWSPEVRALKEKDFNFPATMDSTNISVILDTAFFKAYENPKNKDHELAHKIYWEVVKQMMSTGEPGFSVNVGDDDGEDLRNACTEITSRDDSDICNLGSINMARVTSLAQFKRLVEIGIAFLMAGTVYSDVPYPKVDRIRSKNRRLGLGLMGLHEWLLKRGKKYGPDAELEEYLKVYRDVSDAAARQYAKLWNLSRPVKVRAIAPTGTIGIVAETTTGIEPIFCVAYKRRYRDVDVLNYQYVLDPTAKRLVDGGVDPETIEDAYSISVDRRVAFQAWVQQYVDHGISSTINIPAWGTEDNNEKKVKGFGEMLMRDLPKLRGITVYPDGARGGQPLSPVKYATAEKHVGQIFVEGYDVCDRFKAGSCGA